MKSSYAGVEIKVENDIVYFKSMFNGKWKKCGKMIQHVFNMGRVYERRENG